MRRRRTRTRVRRRTCTPSQSSNGRCGAGWASRAFWSARCASPLLARRDRRRPTVGWRKGVAMAETIELTEEQWHERLSPEQYAVLRGKGTEPAFTGAYWDTKTPGLYRCAACDNALFRSDTKYDSGSGWPGFTEPITPEAVRYETDNSFGMHRVEALCGRCGSHLGQVFQDGPAPTGQRYCMNSIALRLDEEA